MKNSYLITWNKGYGESGTYSVSSTEEFLDFFDTRVRSEAAYLTFTNSDDVEDYDIYPLAGSQNPLKDIYQIVAFANSREPGAVIEGERLVAEPILWFASFNANSTTAHAFGTAPDNAVANLLTSGMDPQLISDERAKLMVVQVSANTAYVLHVKAAVLNPDENTLIRGDDPIFDDIFQTQVSSTSLKIGV